MKEQYDVLIIGGGAAGISAAKTLWLSGCRSIAIIEHKPSLGGILLQCAHTGFGADLDGRDYAETLLMDFPKDIPCFCSTTVIRLFSDRSALLSNGHIIRFRLLILATGCLEIPFGSLPVTGTRPSGVFTAGQMQEMINCHHYLPEGPAVILGSGDIGLIMAWQLLELGLKVTVVEKESHMTGLPVNRARLTGRDICFLPGTTILEIKGMPSLSGVTLSDGRFIPCRLLLSAVGLLPQRELLEGRKIPDWVLPAGNCSHIHSRIESVIKEGASTAVKVLSLLDRAPSI